MSANSASRHLRLAVSAAALLLASAQFNGSIATAEPAADLDTLIMASLQNSGRSETASASKTSEPKASVGKSAAAKKLAKKRTKKVEPSVAETAPSQGGGGLLAAIGAVGGGSTSAVDARPSSYPSFSASIDSRVDRSSAPSGPIYVTSSYGQSEPQPVIVQAPTFAFGTPSTVGAPKSEKMEKLASSKADKSGNAAPKQIVAAVAAPSEAKVQPSGIGVFLATLGFGESASSPSTEEARSAAASLPKSSARSTASLQDASKERSRTEAGVAASRGHSNESKSASKSAVATDRLAGSTPASAASVAGAVTVASDSPKPALRDRSIRTVEAANLESQSKKATEDRLQSDVASTAGIGGTPERNVSPKAAKPVSRDSRSAPSIAAAESAPARASTSLPASPSGGLFAALGLGGGGESTAVETTAQIPVAYPEPVIVNRSVAMPRREMAISPGDPAYRVDAGDKLRVVVYGQEGLTNSYAIDAGGGITMPLIGRVVARGLTPAALAADITGRLRKGFIREPSVAVEIEAYRPFFILGEVAAPGQYPYVPNMSVEAAVAIAGGFSPRARRDSVTLTHRADGGQYRESVPLGTSLSPGDTITVGERWF